MVILSLILLLLFAGCAEQPAIETPGDFDPEAVSRMSFLIEDFGDSQLQTIGVPELNDVSREISERFTAAGYQVRNGQESSTAPPASPVGTVSGADSPEYKLIASVGTVALTETPQGFTLDFGNADPRAQNFQKTTTVDIDCRLADPDDKRPAIVLRERKAVPATVAGASADTAENMEKIRRYYVENIGATCHNLLSKLDIYPDVPEPTVNQPQTWKALQVTTEYEEEPSAAGAAAKGAGESSKPEDSTQAGTAPATIPQQPSQARTSVQNGVKAGPVPSGAENATRPVPLENRPEAPISQQAPTPAKRDTAVLHGAKEQSSSSPLAMEQSDELSGAGPKNATTAPAVTTQQNQTGDWRKKKMTIFNQGDTVILKFGPDR